MPRLETLPPELVAEAVANAVVEAVNQGGDTEAIVARALATVRSTLGLDGDRGTPTTGAAPSVAPPVASTGGPAPAATGSGKRPDNHAGTVLTEGDVLAAVRSGRSELRVVPGTIVTALARDAARDARLRLVEG